MKKQIIISTTRTNRLYLVGWQLFYDGATRQDGASVYLQPFALSEIDRTTAERGCLPVYPYREIAHHQP